MKIKEIVSDEELLAQAAGLQPIFVDGFGAFQKRNGVFICVGHFNGVAHINLVVTLDGARESNERARQLLREQNMAASKGMSIWETTKSAH